MATSADLQIVIDAIADGMRRELSRAEGDLKKFSRQADRELQGVDSAFAKLGANIKGVFAGISVAAAVSGLASLTQAALDNAGRIDDARQKAGITAEEYQRLAYAAKQSGVEVGTLDRALVYLNRQLAAGKVEGENLQDAMRQIADRLAATSDGAERVAIMVEAFGRSGADLIPMLEAGSQGLDELTDRADKLGVVLSNEAIAASAEFGDRLDDLKMILTTIVQGALLETLTAHTGEFAAIVEDPNFHSGVAGLVSGLINMATSAAGATARISETISKLQELKVLEAGQAYWGRSPEAGWVASVGRALQGEGPSVSIPVPPPLGSWVDQVAGMGGTVGPAPLAVGAPGAKPAGPAARVRGGGGGGVARARSGGGSRTAIAQAAEDSADFAAVMREVESEFRDAQRVFDQTRTPLERYGAEVRKLDGFLASGMISQETYSRAMVAAMEDLDSATASTAQVTDRAAEAAEQLGMTFSSAFEDAIVGGKGLREILDGLLQDILRISVRTTITQPLAGALTSLLGNITGSLFGGGGGLIAAPGSSSPAAQMSAIRGAFASGGWVKGFGGPKDDNILALLSPGEFVVPADVAKANRSLLEGLPRMAAGGFVGPAPAGGGGNLQVVLENKSSQPLKLESQRQERGLDGKAIIRVLVTDAFKDALRAGELDNSMRSRYGAVPQPIAR